MRPAQQSLGSKLKLTAWGASIVVHMASLRASLPFPDWLARPAPLPASRACGSASSTACMPSRRPTRNARRAAQVMRTLLHRLAPSVVAGPVLPRMLAATCSYRQVWQNINADLAGLGAVLLASAATAWGLLA